MFRVSPFLLAAALAVVSIVEASAADKIKVSFSTKKVPFGTQMREQPVVTVENGEMSVDFSRNTFFTIREITFKGQVVGQASGGTGAVVTWDGNPLGTVHRVKETGASEILTAVDLIVDGKTHPLWAEGKEQFTNDTTYEGADVQLIKKSTIGPFKHQAHFTLKAGSYAVKAVNDFEALEDVPAERFKGYRYTFMHMMPLVMTEWLRVDPDGNVVVGTTSDQPPDKTRNLWTLPARGLALYGPSTQLGIAFWYPKGQPALTEYGFRGGKDTKYRAMHFDKDNYTKGETRQWTLTLEPFAATTEEWVKKATGFIEGAE